MSITASSLERFLDDLASGAPTPGGGSAAAAMGAMGAGLISMVCNVTLSKPGFEHVAGELTAIRDDSEQWRARLTALIARDITAFEGLMSAYRLPKSTDAEKSRRTAAIQSSLRLATDAPLDCARACAGVIALARGAAQHGFAGVISDAGVGVLAANTALRSAALNVEINAPRLVDREFVAGCTRELGAMLEHCAHEAEAVFALVRSRL